MQTPRFLPLPAGEPLQVEWPTPNHFLLTAPEKFFARTRVNPDYGKPGWTRDCGKRFHRGCDIAPLNTTPTGETTVVMFTDCATGKDFESEEPVLLSQDDVFCVCDGVVTEAVTDEMASDFGRHVVVEHRWPVSGEKFYTLYGHLSEIFVGADSIRDSETDRSRLETAPTNICRGERIGKMGQTSRVADARNWMLVAPHLHFEVRDAKGKWFDPSEFLRKFAG